MTAASVVARAFAIAAPLPFLYAFFSVDTVAFWLVVITFQSLVGAFSGVLPTVAMQMVAYARTGSSSVGGSMDAHALNRTDGPNWPLLTEISHSTHRLFKAITAVWLVFAGVVGTWVVWRPMMNSGDVSEASLVWLVFILGSAIRLLAQPYAALGLGFGQVAAVRRLEASSWLIGGLAAIACLSTYPSLVLAMVALQFPGALNYFQYKRLARRLGFGKSFTGSARSVEKEMWARGWRGAIGTLSGVLTVYGSGFLLAQIGGGSVTAAYLLGLNILGIVGQVAYSPVAAAMPSMAARYAKGQLDEMTAIARRVISRSMWVFAGLAVSAPLAIWVLNAFLPAPIAFPGDKLWLAMSVAALLVRHGGDHVHYYAVTNDIRWHIVNPLFLVLSLGPFIFINLSNVMLLVVVQGLAASLFYLPYSRYLTSARLSYAVSYEVSDFLIPLAMMVVAMLASGALISLLS